MKGGRVPEHFMLSLELDEGNRLREIIEELRTVDRGADAYRMNLNEAEDELLQQLAKRLELPD